MQTRAFVLDLRLNDLFVIFLLNSVQTVFGSGSKDTAQNKIKPVSLIILAGQGRMRGGGGHPDTPFNSTPGEGGGGGP